MPSRKLKHAKTFPPSGPGNFGAAVRRYLIEHDLLIKAADHQTFPWLVTMVKLWLEGEVAQSSANEVPAQTWRELQNMSQKTLQTLFSLGQRNNRIIRPESLGPCIDAHIWSASNRTPFKLALIRECVVYLEHTLWSEPGRIPPPKNRREKRLPNRKREELPDPEAPAWATVNRRDAKKVQIACRVQPHIKTRIKSAARKYDMSQAEWLELTIIQGLTEEGFDVHRVYPHRSKASPPAVMHRTPRRSLSEPDRSRHSSINRADKSTSLRMCATLAELIDDARGTDQDRSQWLNRAIRSFLRSGEAVPKRLISSGPLTEACALRFERSFFENLDKTIQDSGLTKSDWFRRIAYWQIEKFMESDA